MKQKVIWLLVVVIQKLQSWLDVLQPPVPDPFLEMARKCVAIAGATELHRPSRHESLVRNLRATKLMRLAFPDARTRVLKLAIERAINELE